MAFVPASSIAPATVTVSGTVTANQGTAGAAAWLVDGSAVTQPVSGPLTNAQLRAAAVSVDGSAVTQPVSAASLPLPAGAATEATLDRVKRAVNDTSAEILLEEDEIAA